MTHTAATMDAKLTMYEMNSQKRALRIAHCKSEQGRVHALWHHLMMI